MPISSIFSNSNYFSSYIDIKSRSVPSSPSSGVGRLFHSNVDGKLYFKKSNGDVVDLESGGGGGGGAPTDAQYLTLATNATLTDERVLTAGTGITITDGGAGSTATVAVSSSVVTTTGTQTLTNKTLTAPVISSISNTGTVTLPTATTTLVGRDTTDTFTNKTFDADGTGNSIANIENADIKAAAGIVYSKLTLTDSIVNADINSAAAIATSKLADGSSFVTLTGSQTLTNKTLTAPVISTISNTGTLTLPTATDTLVGRATTDTLTNKTISGASNTFSNINYSTLTGTPPKLDDLSAPDDNTDLNASTTAHGLLRKLTGGTTNFLREDGTWASPPGAGGGISDIASATDVTFTSLQDEDLMRYDTTGSEWINGKLVDANVDAAAAIAYSKLDLADSIVNTDINSAAAIATSKLADSANFLLTTNTKTVTNKSINISDNTVTATSRATGDIVKDNGTKYERFARGSANQFLKVNSGGTDIAYEALDVTLDSTALTTTNTKTVTNKTIDADSNTITNIENADIKAAAGIVTTKLADSSNFVLTTRTNSFGDFNQVFKDNRLLINNPADTFAYTIIGAAIGANRNLTLPLLTGNDTVVTEAHTQTLTNKTLTAPVISSISNTGTVTLPTATTTLVGRDTTDTLTNKTFNADGTGNSITNIENADIKAAAGIVYSKLTLTDSVVNADINSAAAIATTKLADSSNFVLTTRTNTFGAFNQIFPTSRLHIGDSNASHVYIVAGSDIAADRTVTLPLLTGNDTFAMAAFTQTLTNKTVNLTDNTVTDTSTAAGDLAKSNGTKFVRFARGSADQYLKVNAGGTDLEWATLSAGGAPTDATYLTLSTNGTLSGERVLTAGNGLSLTDGGAGGNATIAIDSTVATLTGSQTLTNKTLTSPVISSISNTGTITLPTSTDTLVGRATTDTLTNKTINTTDNTITATSQATGDLLVNNGTKFVRKAKGTALQVLRTNSGATDLEWASLDSERTGKAIASGNGSTTVFTIAHGLGSTPGYAFIDCSSHAINRTWTVDGTNITVTFTTAPGSGTDNVIIYWRVIA